VFTSHHLEVALDFLDVFTSSPSTSIQWKVEGTFFLSADVFQVLKEINRGKEAYSKDGNS